LRQNDHGVSLAITLAFPAKFGHDDMHSIEATRLTRTGFFTLPRVTHDTPTHAT